MYSVYIRWIEDIAFQRHAVAALGTSNIGHVRIHASTNSDLVSKRPTYSVTSRESCCSISFFVSMSASKGFAIVFSARSFPKQDAAHQPACSHVC